MPARPWLLVLVLVLAPACATPERLVSAVEARDAARVRSLLDRGLSPNGARGELLQRAIATGDLGVFELLLARGADVERLDRQVRPLGWALEYVRDDMAERLVAHGARVDAIDLSGGCLAHIAHNTLEIARFLLDRGADPNAKNAGGETALMSMVERAEDRDAPLVALLLDRGARVDAADLRGDTALFSVIASTSGIVPLAIVRLLLDRGADPNARNKGGDTPLRRAARNTLDNNAVDVVRLFLDRGVSVDAPGPGGQTALMVAVQAQALDVARLLLDRGASVDQPDEAGYTALHHAVWDGARAETVRFLLERGARPWRTTNQGEDALDLFRAKRESERDPRVAALLVEHGKRGAAVAADPAR